LKIGVKGGILVAMEGESKLLKTAKTRPQRALKWMLALILVLTVMLTIILVIDRDLNGQRASAVKRELELHYYLIQEEMREQAGVMRNILHTMLQDKDTFKHTYIYFRLLSTERLESSYSAEVAALDMWFEEFGHPILAYDDEYFMSFHIEMTDSVDVAYYYWSFVGEEPKENAIPLGDDWFLVYDRHW
jgi:hypothetical protein